MFHQVKAFLLFGLITFGGIVRGASRRSNAKSLHLRIQRSGINSISTTAKAADRGEPILEVVNKTEIQKDHSTSCLCEIGFFWHWRIHQCVEQGSWGYECGFFPAEHHHRVCQDELTCEKLAGANDTYTSTGMYKGTAKTFPASCKPCTLQDKCLAGEARHSEECLQKRSLTGEACQTVRVTVPSSATVSATESHAATASAEVEGHEATEEKTATATSEATATVEGVVETSACISVAEAKRALGVDDVESVGEVLAARIIDKASEMAFESASDGAVGRAKERGLLQAEAAARALAEAKAAEEARLRAERMAHEAAAWRAEAGANAEARAAAEERAQGLSSEGEAAEEEEREHRQAQKDAEEEAQENIADVASGKAGRSKADVVPRGPDPVNQTNPLRKISDKDLEAMNP